MLYGLIANWYPSKGYGFIQSDTGRKVFFHLSSIVPHPSLQPCNGGAVRFEVEGLFRDRASAADLENPEAPRAKRVELVEAIPHSIAAVDREKQGPARHPKARRKKPTWRDSPPKS